tara:strand:- start:195 stop:632 length:438 start_codon:yes stop_codon:yes gene_type:complete
MIFFKKNFKKENPEETKDDIISVMALLIEASNIDGDTSELEIKKIKDMVSKYFKLDDESINLIYKSALELQSQSVSFHNFTSNLNKNYSYEEKINIIEMLWFVVLVDNVEHDFESNLMRRICGLLYIKDVDSGKIKKTVKEKLNI